MLLWYLIAFYGAFITAYTILRYTISERLFVVAWLNNFTDILELSTVALALFAVVFHHTQLLIFFIVPASIFLLRTLPMYFPRQSSKTVDQPEIKLLTHNMSCAPRGYDELIANIRRMDADVVAIQELSTHAVNQLDASLGDKYPYRALHPDDNWHGQGVFSKFPILDDIYWSSNLGQQRVTLDVNGREVVLYNAHPDHNILPGADYWRKVQKPEIDALLNKASEDKRHIILAGDFNMTDQAKDYRRISRKFNDAFRQVGRGSGATFPAHKPYLPPLARIDFVFHSDEFKPVRAEVLPVHGGSDHHPLYVELCLNETR